MRIKPWVKMPSDWILNGLMAREFTWGTRGAASRSAGIAALQLWIGLVTQAEEIYPDDTFQRILEARLTYNALSTLTGLSRALIASGISALKETGLIVVETEKRASTYHLAASGKWCKLPARALYGYFSGGTTIRPFNEFQKRAVCELDALKMYLYYAAIRPNHEPYSHATFETISAKTGVAEKRIPRANAFLINCQLLANLSREKSLGKTRQANRYYILGHSDLFVGRAGPTAAA